MMHYLFQFAHILSLISRSSSPSLHAYVYVYRSLYLLHSLSIALSISIYLLLCLSVCLTLSLSFSVCLSHFLYPSLYLYPSFSPFPSNNSYKLKSIQLGKNSFIRGEMRCRKEDVRSKKDSLDLPLCSYEFHRLTKLMVLS